MLFILQSSLLEEGKQVIDLKFSKFPKRDMIMQHLQPPKYTKIEVPRVFLEEVKEYINYLVARKHMRSNNPDMFLYPE